MAARRSPSSRSPPPPPSSPSRAMPADIAAARSRPRRRARRDQRDRPAPAHRASRRSRFDHMQHLGDTLAAIAGEKAGIIKRGVPAVDRAAAAGGAGGVRGARGRARRAAVAHGHEWRGRARRRPAWSSATRPASGDLPLPALAGAHQIDNAGIGDRRASAMLDARSASMTRAVRAASPNVEWPARLQRLTRGPLATLLPPGWELWLDGGHNADGGRVAGAWPRLGGRQRPSCRCI